MDNIKSTSITFPYKWTIKLTTYKIRFRKAFNMNDVDESFCTIINSRGGSIIKEDFAKLIGFDLNDSAENDIFYIYLNDLKQYNLIEIDDDTVNITELGEEAITSKLKYKYFFASVQLMENHDVIGEGIDFPFKDAFGIHCNPVNTAEPKDYLSIKNSELENKLQFQLFENDVYKGEVVEIVENKDPKFDYSTYDLQCRTTFLQSDCQIHFYRNDSGITPLDQLLETSGNSKFREELTRQGRFYLILDSNDSITAEILRTYIDLCDWQALSENPNVDWNNPEIFELFKINGDGSVWRELSEKVPIKCIKVVLERFKEYWNWPILSRRLENSFIKDTIHSFNWDFEELSYKSAEFVMDLLSAPLLKEFEWDWNYLSQNLPDEFIEDRILDFNWDFYVITTTKNEVFKNVFRKNSKNLGGISEKPWNWKYVSEEININFLYRNLDELASRIEWPTVLYRLFNDQDVIANCLTDESFRSLLKSNLPRDFRVSEQKYLWSVQLINFLEDLNLINWETRSYIKGLDTNEGVEWNEEILTRYHGKIITQEGFANVSKNITSWSLLERFPTFSWDWEAVSRNKDLIENPSFTENAFSGKTYFTDELLWCEIFSMSSYDVNFWNNGLPAFYKTTNREKHFRFWELLTNEEEIDFIFSNSYYPWDWRQVTQSASIEAILESLDYDDFITKWDWEIATQKLEKETILENLEDLNDHIDWSFVINEVLSSADELRLDRQLPRIAACLSILTEEKRKQYWKELTAAYSFPQLFSYVAETHKLSVFEWDWDLISSHKHFPTDLKTLNRFKNKINWTIFSENVAILQKFHFGNWESFGEWFRSTDTYLSKFASHWNWKILSQNDELTYNRQLLAKYSNQNWDWEYLSEFGSFLRKQNKDKKDYLVKIIKEFPKIDFSLLSKRVDIHFDADLILSTKDKDWDWQVLSNNKEAEITDDLILKLKDKNWNWGAISKRKDIVQKNETLLDLIEKDWDWQILSQNDDLVFNPEFIEGTKSKPWDWRTVSRHKSFSPSVETLVLTKNFDLDWDHLSQHPKLNPTRELLSKFEEKWNWSRITQNDRLNLSNTDFLLRFVNRWNWSFICESGNLLIDKKALTQFKKHLDWDLISANTSINFTEEIIQEFVPYWNWTKLRQNKRVEELLGDYVTKEVERSATLSFLDKMEKQYSPWKGNIYHFTHIDNAVEIIKNRKILSRNRANIQGDAAGNVVHRRGDAHDYARFYFRPQTPTQFYNEFLGKNITDKYYDRARNLGFPKCPLPIFFKFSLKEVLFKDDAKCCVSNGNMQKTATCFNPIEQMLSKFNFEYLYSDLRDDWENYMNYAQQEFLVRNELSFDDLSDFKIVCASYVDKNLLINLLGEEQQEIFSKIEVDSNYYNLENPRIDIKENENTLTFSTNFYGDGYFILNGSSDMRELEIVSGDLNSIEDDKIIFKSNITVENKSNQNLTLRFIDESNRNWFIYSKKNSGKHYKNGLTSEMDKNLVWQ